MLFANTCHRAYVHAQTTRDFRSAARLMRAAGASLDESLMLLLGIHQRQRRPNVPTSPGVGSQATRSCPVG